MTNTVFYVKFFRELGAAKVADMLIALEHDPSLKKALWQMFLRARRLQFYIQEPITLDEPILKKLIARLEQKVGMHPALAGVVIEDFDHLVERGTYSGHPFSQPYGAMADMMRTMRVRIAARKALEEIEMGGRGA